MAERERNKEVEEIDRGKMVYTLPSTCGVPQATYVCLKTLFSIFLFHRSHSHVYLVYIYTWKYKCTCIAH